MFCLIQQKLYLPIFSLYKALTINHLAYIKGLSLHNIKCDCITCCSHKTPTKMRIKLKLLSYSFSCGRGHICLCEISANCSSLMLSSFRLFFSLLFTRFGGFFGVHFVNEAICALLLFLTFNTIKARKT